MRSALTVLLALLCIGLATCAINTNGSYTGYPQNNTRYFTNQTCYHAFRATFIKDKLLSSTTFNLSSVNFTSTVRGYISQICSQTPLLNFAEESGSDGQSTGPQPTEEELGVINFWNKLIWRNTPPTQNGGVAEWLRQRRLSSSNNLLEMTNPPSNDLDCNLSCYQNGSIYIAENTERLDSIANSSRPLNSYDVQSLIIHALTVIDSYNLGKVCNNDAGCWSTKENIVNACKNQIDPYWGSSPTASFGNPIDSQKRNDFGLAMYNIVQAMAELNAYAYCYT